MNEANADATKHSCWPAQSGASCVPVCPSCPPGSSSVLLSSAACSSHPRVSIPKCYPLGLSVPQLLTRLFLHNDFDFFVTPFCSPVSWPYSGFKQPPGTLIGSSPFTPDPGDSLSASCATRVWRSHLCLPLSPAAQRRNRMK